MLDLDKFIAGMDEEQLTNLRRVMKAAQKYNINPEFVLPMVKAESNFKHVKNPDSGAFGVMQLMPATASSLKVDPNDVDENIEGGMRLLKELSDNKKIGSDPYKVLAGYNASPTTPFLTSGNLDDLPLETLNHMRNVSKYYGGVLPSLNAGEAAQEEPEAAPADTNPAATTGAPPPPKPRVQDANVTNGAPELSDKALALLGGGIGLTVGTTGVLAPKAYGLLKGAGSYLFGGNTPAPMPRVEPSLAPGAQAAGEFGGLSAAQQGEQLAQNLENEAASASGGRGVRGWLAGRTSSAIPVPDELVGNVATLKGQGPASASAAEAQHAANVEKLLTMNEPPSRWKPATPGGKIVVSTAPQTAGPRTYGPAPIKAQAAQTGPFTIGSGEAPIVGGAKAAAPAVAAAPQPAAALPVTAPAAQGESALGRFARGAGNVVRPVANIGLSGLSGILSAKELYEAEKNRRMYGWTPETTLQYMSGLGGLIGTVPTLPTRVVGGAMQVIPMMARPGNYKAYEDAGNAGLY